ncbi:MAG: hypothetical protein HQL87_02815 [Magnetococcales bacterium]|nr:hypothetical protein [Magnetococcales bacterium]
MEAAGCLNSVQHNGETAFTLRLLYDGPALIIVSAIPVSTLDSRLRGNDERIPCHTNFRHAREGGHPGEFVDETMIKADGPTPGRRKSVEKAQKPRHLSLDQCTSLPHQV